MKVAKNSFIEFQNVIPFEESRFKYNNGAGWEATTLVAQAEKEGLKPFKLYFRNINIGFLPFDIEDLYDFIVHCKRVEQTDTKYPVILSETGLILDGWHRVVKAILAGKEYVMAVRFYKNPPFDFEGEE